MAACSSGTSVRPSPSPTEARFDKPVPADCPAGPKPAQVDPATGTGVGAAPVWALSFESGPTGAVLRRPEAVPSTEYGLELKLAWGVAPAFRDPIHIGGVDLGNGAPLWFRIGRAEPGTEAVLEPTHPGAQSSSPLLLFTGYVYLHRSGCYQLFARWPGGSWSIPFAAGA